MIIGIDDIVISYRTKGIAARPLIVLVPILALEVRSRDVVGQIGFEKTKNASL